MNREIGSDFWLSPLGGGQILLEGAPLQTVSGRTALDFILQDMGAAKKAYLPRFLCDSMIQPFTGRGIRVSFYPVTWERGGLFIHPDPDEACDVVLLMSYFGFYAEETTDCARAFHDRGKRVVEDMTHSLFSQCLSEADYAFASLRKWDAAPAGGLAIKRGEWSLPPVRSGSDYARLRRLAEREKQRYMDGETADKAGYLDLFARSENALNRDYRGFLAPEFFWNEQEAAQIRRRRQENAAYLTEQIRAIPGITPLFPSVSHRDCPLAVPVMVKDGLRDALRRFLTGEDIYCPVHWPRPRRFTGEMEEDALYSGMLSLVCDQRYGPADMDRTAAAIRRFFDGIRKDC